MKLKTFKSIKDLEKEIEAYEKITQKKEDKPENYPLATFVQPSGAAEQKQRYEIIFSGYTARTANLFDSFELFVLQNTS